MHILGIETSTEVCSVGLVGVNGLGVERSVIESHIHSEKLLTLADEVLKSSAVSPRELTAVAVSIGPGSFSGLRIGLSTAKGLCYARSIPLIAVPTLSSMASSAFEEHEEWNSVVIALDAKQGEFYTGRFRRSGQRTDDVPIRVLSREELTGFLDDDDVVLTDSIDELRKEGENKRRFFGARGFTGGAMVAALGRELFLMKRIADLEHTEPMYLKDFVVRSSKKA